MATLAQVHSQDVFKLWRGEAIKAKRDVAERVLDKEAAVCDLQNIQQLVQNAWKSKQARQTRNSAPNGHTRTRARAQKGGAFEAVKTTQLSHDSHSSLWFAPGAVRGRTRSDVLDFHPCVT